MKEEERWAEIGRFFPDPNGKGWSGYISLGILGEIRVLVRPNRENTWLNVIVKASRLPFNQLNALASRKDPDAEMG